MALSMDYTDVTGTNHPNSHWRIVQLNLGIADTAGSVLFYGYHDLASWQAGKQPLTGAIKNYTITSENFLALYDQPIPQSPLTGFSLTSNVAMITTGSPHDFQQGDTIIINGINSTFNGTWLITAVPTPTTFSYALVAADVTSQVTVTGTASLCIGDALKNIIYGYVEEVQDTPDPNNQDQLVSFFATATNDPEN